MSTPTPDDHAQRTLEQHALRNVRGLVDRIDSDDAARARTQKRALAGLIVGAVVALALIAAVLAYMAHRPDGSTTIVVEPVKTPQAPGAPR